MDKHKIDRIIENPQLLLQEEMEELGKISDQFPYFGAAQIILARSYQQKGDYRFTDQLHQAAVYANNRHVLYHWVNPPVEAPASEHRSEPNFELKSETENKLMSEETSAENTETISELASLILQEEAEENLVESAHQDEQHIEQVHLDKETASFELSKSTEDEITQEPLEPKEMDPMDKQILLEALHRSIEVEVTPEAEKADEVLPSENLDTIGEDPTSYAAWMLRRSKALHFGEGAVSKLEHVANEVPAEAQDWIRQTVEKAEDETETEAEREREREREREQEFAREAWQEISETGLLPSNRLSHGAKKMQVTDGKSHQKDLIDRFIRLEPNISRGKISDYAAGNIAKESLEEDYSMVTETIAQLYAKQGKFDKARKAYRKLIELYPEKSVYFAAQLKNLDKHKK